MKTVRRILLFFVLAGILVIFPLALFTAGIPVSLSLFREKVEAAASEALRQEVRIEGPIRARLHQYPRISVEGFVIANPRGWEGDVAQVARLDSFEARISIRDLLQKRIVIPEIAVDGLELSLEENDEGRSNWNSLRKQLAGDPESSNSGGYQLIALEEINVSDASISHQSEEQSESGTLTLSTLTGSIREGEPMLFGAFGTLREEPFDVAIESGSLRRFLDEDRDWPLQISGNHLGIRFSCSGVRMESPEAGYLDFDLQIENYTKLEAALRTQIPDLGAIAVTGRLHDARSGFLVQNLKGTVHETAFEGSLKVDRTRPLPHVSGEVKVGFIETDVIFKKNPKDGEAGNDDLSKLIPGEVFLPITGDVRLTVDEIINPKTSARDAILQLHMTESRIDIDAALEVANVPFTGSVAVGEFEDGSRGFEADLTGTDADIGEIFRVYTGIEGAYGPVETARLQISGHGTSIIDAMKNRRVDLTIENAELIYPLSENGLKAEIDRVELHHVVGEPVERDIEGRFRGLPFTAHIAHLKPEKAGPDLEPFVDFSCTIAGAKVRVAGDLRRDPSEPPLPLSFALSGERIGALAPLTGMHPDADIPFDLKGELFPTKEKTSAKSIDGMIGSSDIGGSVTFVAADEAPLISVEVHSEKLVLEEMIALFSKEAPGEDSDPNEPGVDFDAPIVPGSLELPNVDVDLTIDELVAEVRKVTNLSIKGGVRDSKLASTPFEVTVDDSLVDGTIAFDLKGETPLIQFGVTARELDLGRLLSDLDFAKDVVAEAGELTVEADIRGQSLREILGKSDFKTTWRNTTWVLEDRNTKARLPIEIEQGTAVASRGEDLLIEIDGRLLKRPLRIDIRSNGLEAIADHERDINFELDALVAGTDFDFKGDVDLPLNEMDLDLVLTIASDDLSRLDEILKVDLPPIGPYILTGKFSLDEKGYLLRNFDFIVGESDLSGDLAINTLAKPPRVVIDFETDTIQLDDFQVRGWSAFGENDPELLPTRRKPVGRSPANPITGLPSDSSLIESVEELDDSFWQLMSPEVLNSLDAEVSLNVGEVVSGRDHLGLGAFHGRLEGGQVTVDKLHIDVPGGEVDASYTYHPKGDQLDSSFKLKTSEFDYGILARRVDPDTEMAGIMNIDIEASGVNMPVDSRILSHGEGHLRFDIWPVDVEADVFDLWATNLLVAMLPKLDPSDRSEVNCIVAEFNLLDGHLLPETIVIDTTRVRAIGTGDIDMRAGELTFRFEPIAKTPQFFNLGFPITINGEFEDFEMDFGNLGLGGMVSRFAGNTVFFPLKMLIGKRISRDGSDLRQSRD